MFKSKSTIIEFNKVCRTCLSSSTDTHSLYTAFRGLTTIRYDELLMSFTPIKYSDSDGLPAQICDNCTAILNLMHAFKLKCLETDKILRNCEQNEFSDNTSSKDNDENIYNTEELLNDPLSVTNTRKDLVDPVDLITNESAIKIEINYDPDPIDGYGSAERDYDPATGTNRFPCTICDMKFNDLYNLGRHRQMHKVAKPYLCTICGRQTVTRRNLMRHMLTHSEERPYSCAKCTNKSYKTQQQLRRHMITHSGAKPYACQVCNSSFQLRDVLKQHMRRHTGEKPYSCKYCGKSFGRTGLLTVHLRTHTGEKPYLCKYCDVAYTQTASLQEHEKLHTGGRKYSCDICSWEFTYRMSLVKHMRVHNNAVPHNCDVCAMSFYQTKHLMIHMQSHLQLNASDNSDNGGNSRIIIV